MARNNFLAYQQKMVANKDNKEGDILRVKWKESQKILLRFFVIYFFIQVVPLDWKYYAKVFAIDWGNLYYGDIFDLSRYMPRFLQGSDTFANWVIAAILAIVGTVLWTYLAKSKEKASPLNYDYLYYWLRVILRYRLALAVIAYGFIKIFPLQAPFPSLSTLNTRYGDMTAWKIFNVSLGAAPVYETFLGVVEVLGGLLLLYRKTASIGAFVIVAFTGNVWLTNLAYEGGEVVYSLYITVIALFLFAYDLPRLASLLAYERLTLPNTFRPVFGTAWKKRARWVLKGGFVLFVAVIYGFRTYDGYVHNPHNIPQTAGIPDIAGIYNVKEFVINQDTLPYSTTDTVRWRDVVFETWSTISIRSNRPVRLDTANVEQVSHADSTRIYELAGSAGRHYYAYDVDTVRSVLKLKNKNRYHAGEYFEFSYVRPDDQTVILTGVDEQLNELTVTLEKIDKKYLFIEGRKKALKL